jgi:hypothetical protein
MPALLRRTVEAAPEKGEVGPVSNRQPKPTTKTPNMNSPRTLLATLGAWLVA